jgi:hypothetical protein
LSSTFSLRFCKETEMLSTPGSPMLAVPRWVLSILNNAFEIERKLAKHGDPGNALRNIEKLKAALAEADFFFEDPMDQPFRETRTDLEASISGTGTDDLVVVEVIKPIVRFGNRDSSRVVQKGIVVVQSRGQQE